VLSRVCASGLDYTKRTNKYAHHIVLDDNELPRGGPAWLLSQEGFLEETWSGEPGVIAQGRPVRQGDMLPRVCTRWGNLTDDPGWAGVLAESLRDQPNRLVYLVFEPGMEPLSLIAESLALLPPSQRWNVTFSTYFTNLPSDITCTIRGVLLDSEEAKTASRLPNALVIDLTRSLGLAKGGALVRQAQTGEAPPVVAAPVAPPPLPEPEPIQRHQGRPVKAESRARRTPESETYGFAEPPPLLPPAAPVSRKKEARSPKWKPNILITAGAALLGPLLIGLAYALWSAHQSNAELDKKKDQVAELEKKNNDLQARVDDLNSQSDRFSVRERTLNGQIEQLQKKVDDLNEEKKRAELARKDAVPGPEVVVSVPKPPNPGGSNASGNPNTGSPAPTAKIETPRKEDKPGPTPARGVQLLKKPLPLTSSQEAETIIAFEGSDKKILDLKLIPGKGSPLQFNDGKDDKSWTVTFQTQGNVGSNEDVELAHFEVKDSSVSFHWDKRADSSPATRSACQTLRDCVLSVEREGEAPERHLLRTVVIDKTPFDVAKRVQGELTRTKPRHEFGFPVKWKHEGRPRGPIYLGKVRGEWTSSDGSKHHVEFGDVTKRVSRDQGILSRDNDGTTVVLKVSVPDNAGQAAPDDKEEAEKDGPKLVFVSFDPPAHQVNTTIVSLQRTVAAAAQSDPAAQQPFPDKNKLEFWKKASASYFLSLSVSLFIEVDGNLVEVARIGDLGASPDLPAR
jgi:cell division protein FtsB